MRKLYTQTINTVAVLLSLFGFQMHAQVPSWEWAKNSVGDNFDSNYSTATDGIGNVYVAGVFQSTTIAFGTNVLTNLGDRDGYLVKYSPSGDVLWAKNVGGVLEQQILGVATDSNNNVYITGDFESPTLTIDNVVLTNTNTGPITKEDMFVAKLDSNGTAIWAKSATGNSYDYGFAIAVDSNGNVFVGGQFVSNSLTIGGITIFNVESDELDHDVFIAKFDASGNALWAKDAGGTSYDSIDAMAIDAAGNLYASGFFYSPTMTFGSTVLSNTNEYGEIYIVKYNTAGVLQWAKKCGGTDDETVRDIKTDSDGNLFVAGHFESPTMTLGTTTLTNAGNNTTDIFLAKYNTSGDLLWAKRAGGVNADIATGIGIDSDNNAYLSGSITSNSVVFGDLNPITTNGSYDIFVAKYDSDGNAVWAKDTGGVGYDLGATATMDSNNNLYVSGLTSSLQVDFDTHIINMSSYSIFTAKMNVAALGVETFSAKNFSVYPNPAINVLHVKSDAEITNSNYKVSDCNGRIILDGKIAAASGDIDVSGLQNGMYILKYNNNSIKFIKE